MIYNCTKPGNRPIDIAATAYYTLHISIYNCTNCDQLHVKICPALHTFSLTCGLRTVYLINLKQLICVDIVKCQVKFSLLSEFLQRFVRNLASTGGPHKISRRAAGWTALVYNNS